MLVGLGASLAFRIGFWNLGLEGQMIFGGIAATGISIYAIGPPLTAARCSWGSPRRSAACCGCCWPVWLKMRLRVNEIIATLLLNYVAMYFLFHLLYGAWQDAKIRVSAIDAATAVRAAPRSRLRHQQRAGRAIAIVIAGRLARPSEPPRLLHALRQRQSAAWRGRRRADRAVDASARSHVRRVLRARRLRQVAGQEGRLTQSFFNGYVFSGVLIAFLSRNDPIVVAVVGFLVAVLFVTGQTLQVFYQIPFTMVQLIQAIIVIIGRVVGIFHASPHPLDPLREPP